MSESIKRGGLNGRLAGHFAMSAAAAMGVAAMSASAQIVYYAPNWSIPATIDGLYINVETQQTGSAGAVVAGWDLNPYDATVINWFSPSTPTGGAMVRYPGATVTTPANLPGGVAVGASSSFGTGIAAFGTAPGNWVLNSDNRFAFRFIGASGQVHYGWGTMSVGATAATRTITEIAYEATPAVPVFVGDRGDGAGAPYDSCATFNPAVQVGSNTLLLNRGPAAPDVALSGCGGTAFGANYFRFVAPLTGTFTFSTCSSNAATRVAVLDGCTSGASQIACNDNACGSSSTVSASLTGGLTYYVVVGAESAGATLPSSLAMTVDGPTILRYTPNWTIPANTTGLYLNTETQVTGTTTTAVPGWDLQPRGATTLEWALATGSGMLRYPGVTTGGSGNLPLGMPVSLSGSYATTTTAVTFGSAAGNWVLNSDNNYFGFRFTGASGQTHYGWGRMSVGATAATRTITEIAIRTVPGVQIRVGETLTFVPPYSACAPFNPSLAVGTSTVALDATASDLALSGCGGTAFKANFFRFVAGATGVFTFSTCSSAQPTRLAVLDGCAAGSNQLACNDDDCGSSSRVSLALTSGQVCFVAVGAESASATLPATIAVTVQSPPVPQCVAALDAVYGDNPITSTANPGLNQTVFTNAAQTTTTAVNNAQFFKFRPTATGAFTIKACLAGDTKLAIGTGCPGVGGAMSTIAYNDDAPSCISSGTSNFGSWVDATCNGATGTCLPLTQNLVAGQTYYICVGGFATGTVINGNLNISGPEGSPCPADYDGDGNVGGSDLTTLLAAWGTPVGDNDGDGNTSGTDLTVLLAAWGPCAP
ncbi:MAG: hypothetical protein FGM37_00785 [Phycisphaerales bacterium]|nr:hypothetical protein [Phycisphaerales bacterium]